MLKLDKVAHAVIFVVVTLLLFTIMVWIDTDDTTTISKVALVLSSSAIFLSGWALFRVVFSDKEPVVVQEFHSTVKLESLVEGMVLIPDAGFDCMAEGALYTVYSEQVNKVGVKKQKSSFYLICDDVKHYLESQCWENGQLLGLCRRGVSVEIEACEARGLALVCGKDLRYTVYSDWDFLANQVHVGPDSSEDYVPVSWDKAWLPRQSFQSKQELAEWLFKRNSWAGKMPFVPSLKVKSNV